MLEDRFGLPTFINNDGDLFAYGEAVAGFLPYVNGLLEKAGRPKRFRNLLGVTLGTGLGGGIVRDGELFTGDNSVAGEMWLLRHKLERDVNAEEGASIRAVRRVYAEKSGLRFEEAPEPKLIYEIAEMNGTYRAPNGEWFRRLIPRAFNLEDPAQLEEFLKGETKELPVPGSSRTVKFDSLQRVGVGISRLGTSEATAIGAYAFALRRLERRPWW